MKKRKIAFVHYSYPPVIGGVEIVLKTQAELFAEEGFEVSLLVGEGKSDNPRVHLHLIPELKSLENIIPGLRERLYNEKDYPAELLALTDTLYAKMAPLLSGSDCIIAHNIFSQTYNPAIGYALLRFKEENPAAEIISWVHDFEVPTDENTHKRKAMTNKALDQFLHKKSDQIHYVAISQFLKDSIFINELGFADKDVTVIPNGINVLEFMYFQEPTKNLIRKFNLLKADPLLLLPSKIVPRKNVDLCVRIVHEMVKAGRNPVMVISAKHFPHNLKGTMDYAQKVDRLIDEMGLRNNIIILTDVMPEIDLRIIRDLYDVSDAVLYLSSYENFGLPLLESAITKTPLFCSPLPVFREVAGDMVQYVDMGAGPQKIAEQILRYLDTTPSSRLFTRACRTFSIRAIFREKLLPFVQTLIHDKT